MSFLLMCFGNTSIKWIGVAENLHIGYQSAPRRRRRRLWPIALLCKRLLHLGLLAAIAASDVIPGLSCRSEKDLKQDLQKYRGASGFVTKTSNIQPPALSCLHTMLEALQCHLLSKDDHFEIIMYSGCSESVSPCLTDFVLGSLVDLPSRLSPRMESPASLLHIRKAFFDMRFLMMLEALPLLSANDTISLI
jgi:hypothetical protein